MSRRPYGPPQAPLLAGALGAAAALGLRAAGLPWADTATLVALLVLLPVLSVLQAGALRLLEVERMGAYLSSALSLLALAGGVWVVGARHGGGAALGLTPLPWGGLLAWTAGLVAAGLAVTAAFRSVGVRAGLRETPLLRHLLPGTPTERAAFTALSAAAGLGEELAYRGYAIPVLAGALGTPAAVVAASAAFGVLHVYQGPLGMCRTAVLGALLAWGFLASGSLWPAIAAHALLDVVLGVALAERMMVPEGPDA